MRRIGYDKYLDKVKGCFAGKAAIGTMGAPYEGVKMRMELKYRPEMTDAMLPNDDLDLQVLWLDVVQKYGADFTSRQLLQRFCEYCDYSPGEYAVMRKNYQCGIYPPYSGKYRNDFYKQGMGCPIRSEIWACLAPGEPKKAAEYASRDGILDHSGESVFAEMFFAAAEAEAFFEDDIYKLIDVGLSVIPPECKFAELVKYVLLLCGRYDDMQTVRAWILYKYGHPDCTNMFQNMGITLAALLLCGKDPIKTGLTALGCGFDTDCTCASAGAMLGIISGGKKFAELTGLHDLKYVLSVRSEGHGDRTDFLSEQIAELGTVLPHTETVIDNAPEVKYDFTPAPEYTFEYDYKGKPCINPQKHGKVVDIKIKHRGKIKGKLIIKCPDPLYCLDGEVEVDGEDEAVVRRKIDILPGASVFPMKNIIDIEFHTENGVYKDSFGICCADVWRVDGPIWRTEPSLTPTALEGGKSYFSFMKPGKDEGESTDNVRDFHLNFARDTDTAYLDINSLFEPFEWGYSDGHIKQYFYKEEDSFRLSDISGFYGPCVFYMSQIIICDEEKDVYIQFGRSAPFELYLNGELLAKRNDCDTFTSENVHISGVKLKKGENRLVLRLTQINADSKFSLVFSHGATCAEHLTDLKFKKIKRI
ncbi:MAG: ADP-ribosylglycohydrolase family protein [Clostridia bacterium]|nr:ADP-ribosylglycohydrolase family protein [Clostridia bacterium]